jgi:hypothetical protein
MESPNNGRADIYEIFNGIALTIPSVKNWFIIVFIGFFVGIWSIGVIAVIVSSAVSNNVPVFVILLMLCFWGAFIIIPLRIFLWNVMGKEIISFEGDVLTLDKKYLLFYKAKSYDLTEAHNFRVQEDPIASIMPFGMTPFRMLRMTNSGTIKFDYGMQTIKFGEGVDEAEANFILEKLRAKKLIKDS